MYSALTMSLHQKLQQRAAERRPIRVGLIGAGKFGSMYLAQLPRTPGVQLVGIADLSPDGARANLARVGWPAERCRAPSLESAIRDGNTHVGEDWLALVRHPDIDVIVESTGSPVAARRPARGVAVAGAAAARIGFGRSSGCSSSVVHRMTACSIALRSSRTLPGQS